MSLSEPKYPGFAIGGQTKLSAALAWLRRNANAEKEPKARAAFIEAYNAVLKIAEGKDCGPVHLKRPVRCENEGCDWIGLSGALIAKDKLRCPQCNSDHIRYFVADAPVDIQ